MTKYLLRAEKESNHKIHDEYSHAEDEARRLCVKESQRIFIWKCIGEVRPKEVPLEVVVYMDF